MFRVAWTQTALNELAQAWTRADSDKRAAITAATQAVDRVLQDAPEDHGESRPGGYRMMFAPPLGVVFQVQPRLSVVRVAHVWTFRRRGEQ
jgi:plasmid stabilization system protein ParE